MLTIQEKIERLEDVKSDIKYRISFYMCNAYSFLFGGSLFVDIPELLIYKPLNVDDRVGWFPITDYKPRIEILNKCINYLKSAL